jgi:uncharacterized protein YjbI with pentapeptide repeats
MSQQPREDRPDLWYVRRSGRTAGSASASRIRRLVLSGRLQQSDEVSRDGRQWLPIRAVPDVMPLQLRRDGSADAAAAAQQARGERTRAAVAIALSALVLVAGVAATVWFGRNGTAEVAPACDAPAAPGVNWSSCRLDGSAWPAADLRDADLSNASFINGRFADATFEGADLAYGNFTGADLSYARLRGARLLGANLRAADLAYADFSGANLAHADLTGARVGTAVWQGAVLDGVIWVDGRRCATGSTGACR